MSTGKVQTTAMQLGIPVEIVTWLVSRFGSQLVDVLFNFLTKKSQPAFMAAMPAAAAGTWDVQSFLVSVLEQFGHTIVKQLSTYFSTKTDIASQLLATLCQSYGTQLIQILIDFLKSPAGMTAVSEA